jgi:spore coat polysaccharide biosynthesis protein SpsF
VLDRFYRCGAEQQADLVVRITADDPLKDPSVISQAIDICIDNPDIDYCSNVIEPSYPEGLDVEVLRFSVLARAHAEARLPSEREHVTPYIWKNPQIFRLHNFRYFRDLSGWRWTVDKPADLEFVRIIFGHFACQPLVPFTEVIAYLESNPHVMRINQGTVRGEGYLKSILSDD